MISASKTSEGLSNHASLIIPPPELRKIIDKTSDFVARNGFGFEERIREKESDNQKFNFLNPNDPYHEYYQFMIHDNKLKKTDKKEEEKEKIVNELRPVAPPKPAVAISNCRYVSLA
jgi:splicing factor 3A subunit 1